MNDKNISIYPFDKGIGFVVIKEKDAIHKIEEQIGQSKIIDHDPIPTLLNKFQKELPKLRKEANLTTKHFSNYIHLMLYHHDFTELLKPTNHPMRTIVSTMGTLPYGTSKYLVDMIKRTLNKNKHRVINSSSFANEAATCETTQEEIQVSYGVTCLYPFVPIDKAITILIDTLKNYLDNLNTSPKLTLSDIHKLTDLCLNKSYFLYENKIRLLENGGPICLSLMDGSII